MSPNGFDVTSDQSFDWPDGSDVVSPLVLVREREKETLRKRKKGDYNGDVHLV